MQLTVAGTVLVVGLLVLGTAGSVTAVASEAGTRVLTSCTTVTEPGEYVLVRDLERAGSGACLSIRASDVVFDGGNHVVSAGGDAAGAGIAVGSGEGAAPLSNVTVRDVGLRGWSQGLRLSATDDATVRDVAATDGRVGVRLDGATDTAFADLTLARNDGWSLYADNGSHDTAGDRVALGGTSVGFEGSDVALAPTDAPPTAPRGYELVGGAIATAGTESGAWLAVELPYAPADLAAANVSAETLVLSHYADGRWSPVNGSTVEIASNVVSANVTRSGTVAVLGRTGEPVPAPPPSADIEYSCDAVSVTVTPPAYDYFLVAFYRQRSTGATGKTLVGPYRGTLDTPFGPDLLITRVEVIVSGQTIAGESIPEDCYSGFQVRGESFSRS